MIAAVAVQHPDAALMTLAEQFIANEQVMRAMPCDAEPGTPAADRQDAEQREIFGRQYALVLQMNALRATTADGLAALARCLAVHNADLAFSMAPDLATTSGRLVRQIIRDAAPEGLGARTAPIAPPSPDAELLQACAAFDVLERAYLATFNGYELGSPEEAAADAEQERVRVAQGPLVARMCELHAVTREGMAARAHSLALWDAELLKDGCGDTGECLTTAIVRDLLAGRTVA